MLTFELKHSGSSQRLVESGAKRATRCLAFTRKLISAIHKHCYSTLFVYHQIDRCSLLVLIIKLSPVGSLFSHFTFE